jgi:hypothetical protein
MKYSKRILSILLLSSFATLSLSCGQTPAVSDVTSGNTTESSVEVKEMVYPYYEGNNLGGKTYTIYNVKKYLWDMICVVQPDEINGETVNDAIYNRNEYVKQKLNFELVEVNEETYADMAKNLQTLVLAGDDIYDAAYMPMYLLIGGLSEGYYQRLNDINTINLNENWWDRVLLDATSIRGYNYFATSAAHLMGFDGLWCLFFNESMMDNLKLEYPYQLVRDGKWTLDKLSEYCKAAANLNGDDSFAINANGKAVYGCTSFHNVVMKFLFGFNVDYVTKNKDDEPVFSCEDENFINACQKLAEYFSRQGEYLKADADSSLDIYYQKFYEKQRTLFLGAELKTAQLLRPMEQSFGIVPFPKLNEAQEQYRSTAVHQCAVFTIPVTNSHPEEIGLIFDALSYESEKRVLEPYFNVLVEQKGLRNEESIEMLNIIKQTRSFDIGVSYQWVVDLETALRDILLKGQTDVAGKIAEHKNAVQEKINKTLSVMEGK